MEITARLFACLFSVTLLGACSGELPATPFVLVSGSSGVHCNGCSFLVSPGENSIVMFTSDEYGRSSGLASLNYREQTNH